MPDSVQKQSNQQTTDATYWGDRLADRVIEEFPDLEMYTAAAGISPSGIVHFGNFRDLFTAYVVVESLKRKGKNARLIFSWDDFDRFRKVPANVDPSFEQYIGLPYTEVPSPKEGFSSYAEMFEKEFETSIEAMGIHAEYLYQTDKYRAGTYDDLIVYSLQNRKSIADVLFSFIPEKAKLARGLDSEEYRDNYYPLSLYSRFTGKDNTKILAYDGDSSLTYKCVETGNEETINIREDRIVKLSWKIDWPMRWKKEGVNFEPGGHDHASPGGSYDTSSKIAREIFNISPPVFEEYKFVGLQGLGSKMSGSKGNVVAPKDLLEIYTPEMLKWLYADKAPGRSFELSFGKGIFRQYSDYDQLISQMRDGAISDVARTTLEISGVSSVPEVPTLPFRQVIGFGQIVQWNEVKFNEALDTLEVEYDKESTNARLPLAKNWLEKYNSDEAIQLLDTQNTEYAAGLNDDQRSQIQQLVQFLAENESASIQELEEKVYAIPKKDTLTIDELARVQKAFFKDTYNLLVGNNIGPRLSTFLWAIDRKKVIELLSAA